MTIRMIGKHRTILLIAALLFSLALAACGSQANNPASQPTAAVRPTPTPTSTPTPTPVPASDGGKNLLINGDAESAPGTTDGSTPVTNIPGWTIAGNFDVIAYGADGGYPADTDPGPTNRGKNFFGGGPNDEVSTGTQTVDVSPMAAALDSGSATYTLSGWLGGFEDQDDNAVLSLQFEDANGQALGQAKIGPVMAADRNNTTTFLQRSTQGTAPRGTRKMLVTLTLTRVSGSANDGYADNLSLTLNTGVSVALGGGQSGSPGTLARLLTVAATRKTA